MVCIPNSWQSPPSRAWGRLILPCLWHSDAKLRVWFNDTKSIGFQKLSPDRPLHPVLMLLILRIGYCQTSGNSHQNEQISKMHSPYHPSRWLLSYAASFQWQADADCNICTPKTQINYSGNDFGTHTIGMTNSCPEILKFIPLTRIGNSEIRLIRLDQQSYNAPIHLNLWTVCLPSCGSTSPVLQGIRIYSGREPFGRKYVLPTEAQWSVGEIYL